MWIGPILSRESGKIRSERDESGVGRRCHGLAGTLKKHQKRELLGPEEDEK